MKPNPSTFSRLEFDGRELRRFHVPTLPFARGSDDPLSRALALEGTPQHRRCRRRRRLILQAGLIVSPAAERRRRGLAQALNAATLASLPGQVAVLDGGGRVVQVNENWEAFAGPAERSLAGGVPVGEDYLEAWRRARASVGPLSESGVRLVEDVLAGRERSAGFSSTRCMTPAGIGGSK